ncbi:peroxiredoxin family protein [Polaribacter porphyrae]|uniref:peroxiredoxin family protein n=1 Tax=Polaribacter porphyrae TaxID=1137780 RepID=UPI00293D3E89|nr:TlpA disulfide reductase family protein [Polaribacter porphyrae]
MTLQKGNYRAVLEVKDNQKLPFIFKVENDSLLTIFNADEKIIVDEISYFNDSIKIQTPVFEGYIIAKIKESGNLEGFFIKPSLDRVVDFRATPQTKNRFNNTTNKSTTNISGSWQTVFSQNTDSSYIAKGIFNQRNQKVTGTFRTTTGDYRYLEGIVDGDSLKLSTFDGAHAFLFKAKITDTTMNGFFYSGNHWKEPFTAKLNNNYQLPKEENLTYIKEGYNRFSFSFPDTKGRVISLNDAEFDNKVVVVQIMGTWCPNCLDESKFLVNYLKNHNNKKIKVVALAFEVAKTRAVAYQRINRLKKRIGVNYPILLAQYGNAADKTLAQRKLPMLNHVISYPTTIFIDKNRKVRKIHTGFNGPATGEEYEIFKKEFESFVDELVNEKE